MEKFLAIVDARLRGAGERRLYPVHVKKDVWVLGSQMGKPGVLTAGEALCLAHAREDLERLREALNHRGTECTEMREQIRVSDAAAVAEQGAAEKIRDYWAPLVHTLRTENGLLEDALGKVRGERDRLNEEMRDGLARHTRRCVGLTGEIERMKGEERRAKEEIEGLKERVRELAESAPFTSRLIAELRRQLDEKEEKLGMALALVEKGFLLSTNAAACGLENTPEFLGGDGEEGVGLYKLIEDFQGMAEPFLRVHEVVIKGVMPALTPMLEDLERRASGRTSPALLRQRASEDTPFEGGSREAAQGQEEEDKSGTLENRNGEDLNAEAQGAQRNAEESVKGEGGTGEAAQGQE